MDKSQLADAVKDSWSPPGFRSDVLAAVSAYNTWFGLTQSGQIQQSFQFISENFIHRPAFLAIQKVKDQIYGSLVDTGVIAISAGGLPGAGGGHGPRSVYQRWCRNMPVQLNKNATSLPLLAALVATSSAPNFAIRQDKGYMTNMGEVC